MNFCACFFLKQVQISVLRSRRTFSRCTQKITKSLVYTAKTRENLHNWKLAVGTWANSTASGQRWASSACPCVCPEVGCPPSTDRKAEFIARCVNSLHWFQQYLSYGYLHDITFPWCSIHIFPSPLPPPAFQLQGRYAPPGRGASSFYGTAGCPVLSLHPLFSESSLLTLFQAAPEEQTCAAEHTDRWVTSQCLKDTTIMSSSWAC